MTEALIAAMFFMLLTIIAVLAGNLYATSRLKEYYRHKYINHENHKYIEKMVREEFKALFNNDSKLAEEDQQ